MFKMKLSIPPFSFPSFKILMLAVQLYQLILLYNDRC